MRELQFPTYSASSPQRVSWGAIFSGAIFSLAVWMLLTLLGTGIGLTAAPGAGAGRGLAMDIGIGAAVWMFVMGIISFFFGGWISGRLTPISKVSDSVIHGVVSWSLATLVLFFLTSAAVGGIMGGIFNVMGSAVGVAGRVAAAPGISAQQAGQEARRTVRQAETSTGLTPEQMRAQAASSAKTAAQTAGAVSLYGFFVLLCNAIASGLGARAGVRLYHPTPVDEARARPMPVAAGR